MSRLPSTMSTSSAYKHVNKNEYTASRNLPSTQPAAKPPTDPPCKAYLLTEKRFPLEKIK